MSDLSSLKHLTDAELSELIRVDTAYSTLKNGFYTYEGKKEQPDYNGYAEYAIKEHSFKTFDSGCYQYDKSLKHYVPITDLGLDHLLAIDTTSKVKPQHMNFFLRTLKRESYLTHMPKTDNLINLANGTLDIRTKELKPHSPDNFFLYRLDHTYDPKAECPEWMKFLNYIFEGNEEFIMISAQIFGYILYGGYPWLHKAFVLYGEGRNGKSTYLDVLRTLIGRNNCSAVSMAKIDREFSAVDLIGKLANIVEESPTDKINAEIFKTATAGGYLRAARKYQDEFTFPCHARLIFAANKMPQFGESTGGLNSRMYFIPFNKFIPEEDRDANIFKKLIAELPGILNWALASLEILLEDKRLPEAQGGKDVMEEFKIETNSVYEWCLEYLIFDEDAPGLEPAKVYGHYKSFCDDNGRMAVSSDRFYKEIKKYINEKYPGVDQVRVTRAKKRVYPKIKCAAHVDQVTLSDHLGTSTKNNSWSYLNN